MNEFTVCHFYLCTLTCSERPDTLIDVRGTPVRVNKNNFQEDGQTRATSRAAAADWVYRSTLIINPPPPPGTTIGPQAHTPTLGSWEVCVSYERGTPVQAGCVIAKATRPARLEPPSGPA